MLLNLKYTIFILFFIAGISNGYCQKSTEIDDELKSLVKAHLSKDAKGLLDLTFPRLLEAMGGKTYAIKKLQESYSSLDNDGVSVDTVYYFNRLNPLEKHGIIFTLIPQVLVISPSDTSKKFIKITNLMAVKLNKSSKWTFLEYSDFNENQIDQLFPEFKGKFKLPSINWPKPLLIPKEETEGSLKEIFKQLEIGLEKIIQQ
ncbi:hypothetical protein LZQ00_10910 [Sphingobacterium sp. SRCM116780]|uniref:hypothetical protein n=1 Tax=Sphingobacterium sp. SRCM116780 TaxID=2907623 RepID=UPI001F1FA038|nr:hypothetical protein [Sphingobacterium sp. SRCM116780]UIR54786.1 hypothetical protein LZQ00_10910 [Sphingobacterium sp. SRCM116780]